MEQTAERVDARASMAIPAAAVVLAAAGAVLLVIGDIVVGLRSDAADSVFILTGILGWTLVVWAAIMTGAGLVSAARRVSSRLPVTRLEVALLGAALAVIVVLLVTHPLWGSGSASA
jgi:hypothetical protein